MCPGRTGSRGTDSRRPHPQTTQEGSRLPHSNQRRLPARQKRRPDRQFPPLLQLDPRRASSATAPVRSPGSTYRNNGCPGGTITTKCTRPTRILTSPAPYSDSPQRRIHSAKGPSGVADRIAQIDQRKAPAIAAQSSVAIKSGSYCGKGIGARPERVAVLAPLEEQKSHRRPRRSSGDSRQARLRPCA